MQLVAETGAWGRQLTTFSKGSWCDSDGDFVRELLVRLLRPLLVSPFTTWFGRAYCNISTRNRMDLVTVSKMRRV